MNDNILKIKNSFNRKGNDMLINSLFDDYRKIRQEIKDNEKFYSITGRKEQLTTLKTVVLEAYAKAIEEVETIKSDYNTKIDNIQNSQYIGYSTNPETLENIKFAKSRILAEIRIDPQQKNSIIDNSLLSKLGSQAILELIQNNELDNSYWTEETFKKAYLNSKSQKEIDWELDKQKQVETLQNEVSGKINYGKYLALQKIINGDVVKRIPTLERQIDDEIASFEKSEGNKNE